MKRINFVWSCHRRVLNVLSGLAWVMLFTSVACAEGRASGAEPATRGWDGRVFYEVFVRSFADSTEGPLANDGIGDLRGLIDKLDYLNDGDPDTHDDLGVTGIWLMPIMQSTSYHGYDTTDYYTVEEDYGTNEDFRELMGQAHARGIRVIVDLVLNHASHKHPFFVGASDPRSEYRDWFLWSRTLPDYKGPWGERVWHELDGAYYYGVFNGRMPDLNYRNPAVTREMFNVTRYWLTEMKADGFRLDAIKHLIEQGERQEHTGPTHEWLRGYYRFYKQVNPGAITVGEVWADTPTVAKYVGDQMDLAFDFDQAHATLDAAKTGNGDRLAGAQAASGRLFPRGQFATFLANHDMDRTMSQLDGDPAKAKLAATIQLTSPGVPFIYYGEEIGMSGVSPDPDRRTPMQWTPDGQAGFTTAAPWRAINPDFTRVNVREQDADRDSLLNLYRRLIRLRNEHPALAVGDFAPVQADHPSLYAFLRRGGGETVLVLVNLGPEPVDRYTLGLKQGDLRRIGGIKKLLHGEPALVPGASVGDGPGEVPGEVPGEAAGGYQPIAVLAGRTGYVLALEAGPGR